MVRSAAKNHERVAVVVDPKDYDRVLGEIETRARSRPSCALSFAARPLPIPLPTTAPSPATWAGSGRWQGRLGFPDHMHPSLHLERVLRYGENPHQKAAFYSWDAPSGMSLAKAEVLQGKELSYNNLLDLDAAMKLCAEFEVPAACIIKHTNPCGIAVSTRA